MIPTSILFVCLGNICRSPMAESVFNKISDRENTTNHFEIDSAGLIACHQGELPDNRMCYFADKREYTLKHRSRPFTRKDFDRYDMIIGMDDQNIDRLKELAMTLEENAKIHRLTDFCRFIEATNVPDPYYGGDKGFNYVIDIIEDACEGLYSKVKSR